MNELGQIRLTRVRKIDVPKDDSMRWRERYVAAGESGSGIRIIDVWESKQQFELFQTERLGPAMRKVGIELPSNGGGGDPRAVQEMSVHNLRK